MKDDKKSVDSALVEKLLSDPAALEMGFRRFSVLMAYYRCAMMEIETKFNVLNEEFSLRHDRNPISTIKTRLKSPLSIKHKLERKNQPFSLASIEENVNDIAGMKLKDAYSLARKL